MISHRSVYCDVHDGGIDHHQAALSFYQFSQGMSVSDCLFGRKWMNQSGKFASITEVV